MTTDLATDPGAQPKPITAEQFEDALNVLPPWDWRTRDGIESFTLCEAYDTDEEGRLIYQRYFRIGTEHWCVLALRSTPVTDLVAMCRRPNAPTTSL